MGYQGSPRSSEDRSEVQTSPDADEIFEEEADEVFEEETKQVFVDKAEEAYEETRHTLDIKSLRVSPRAGTPALKASEPEELSG